MSTFYIAPSLLIVQLICMEIILTMSCRTLPRIHMCHSLPLGRDGTIGITSILSIMVRQIVRHDVFCVCHRTEVLLHFLMHSFHSCRSSHQTIHRTKPLLSLASRLNSTPVSCSLTYWQLWDWSGDVSVARLLVTWAWRGEIEIVRLVCHYPNPLPGLGWRK